MSESSDVLIIQFYFKELGKATRSSFSIDPVLFRILARRMGDPSEAKAQLRRWAKKEAEARKGVRGVSVSRRVHRHVYELLEHDS